MLKIDNLTVKIGDRKILDRFELEIKDGEIHAIMGPNGTGKSTLSKIIMGSKEYNVVSGTITFNGEDITDLSVDERSRKGIFLSMQNPISVEGVTNREFLRTALNARSKEPISLFDFIKKTETNLNELGIKNDVLTQNINDGSSGGERKKNEVLQIKVLEPSFIILDEIDSGLDVDSLKVVCKNINKYKEDNPKTSILIITHYSRLLDYIKPDFVHKMMDGHIVETGDSSLAYIIDKTGYGDNNA